MFAGATARATSVVRWIALASIVGVLSGLLSGAFIEALQWATDTRSTYTWLVYTLPLAGFIVGAAYATSGHTGIYHAQRVSAPKTLR
jgi:H+/Cl- antiporter ClcA